MRHQTSLIALLLSVALTPAAWGLGLSPEHVLVVANRLDAASMRVADHYMAVRGIPAINRINIAIRIDTDIDRDAYFDSIVQPVRQHIDEHDLRDRIRCIALSYNLPLRVRQATDSPSHAAELKQITRSRQQLLRDIYDVLHQIDRIADWQAPATRLPTTAALGDYAGTIARATDAMARAGDRIAKLPDHAQQSEATRQLLSCRVRLLGPASMLPQMAQRASRPADQLGVTKLKDHVAGVGLAIDRLSQYDTPAARREVRELRAKYFGLLGSWRQNHQDAKCLGETSGASVDSELALLWHDNSPAHGRAVNHAAYMFEQVREQTSDAPTLIVARLHARSERTVMRMIDDAVAVEKVGLRGKVFIDARSTKQAGHVVYDRSLLQLGAMLDAMHRAADDSPLTQVDVDRYDAVFASHSGDDAALYCGWYQLSQFNDPLRFVRGAVGYHIASFEATDFSRGSRQWVPGLLDAGCAVSIGSVAEPYLDAFPLPGDFFQLLATGRYTVGEVFALTCRYRSWQMVMCGDPLYNPFKAKPAMSMEQVRLALPVYGPISAPAEATAQAIVQPIIGQLPSTIANVPTE